MSLLVKSLPIQFWLIMDEGTLIMRLTLGAKVHILLSLVSVPLPASLFGLVTRINDVLSPLVQLRIDMLLSQSGRWMVMVISE